MGEVQWIYHDKMLKKKNCEFPAKFNVGGNRPEKTV